MEVLNFRGGAMVLGKLSVPGCPTNLGKRRARAYRGCSRCGWGWFGHFFLSSAISPTLWETARYRLKYRLKGPLSPKQPTNQPIFPAFENGGMQPCTSRSIVRVLKDRSNEIPPSLTDLFQLIVQML